MVAICGLTGFRATKRIFDSSMDPFAQQLQASGAQIFLRFACESGEIEICIDAESHMG